MYKIFYIINIMERIHQIFDNKSFEQVTKEMMKKVMSPISLEGTIRRHFCPGNLSLTVPGPVSP